MAAAGGTGTSALSGLVSPGGPSFFQDPGSGRTPASRPTRTETGCVELQPLEYQAGLYNY